VTRSTARTTLHVMNAMIVDVSSARSRQTRPEKTDSQAPRGLSGARALPTGNERPALEWPESGTDLVELATPSRLGSFSLLERIGAGGVGVVHRAIDLRTNSVVAIKTLRYRERQHKKTIHREIDLLAHCSHPGIVRLHDHSSTDDLPWYAMELLRGSSLRQILQAQWPESSRFGSSGNAADGPASSGLTGSRLQRTLRILYRLCLPLAHLHRRGVVHCDVKPENVFVCPGDHVVLLDFGAARRSGDASSSDDTEWTTFGTWMYMAPECRVGAPMDHRADIYAVGCILQELVTGRVPMPIEPWRRAAGAANGAGAAAVPRSLRELVERLTAVDPDSRPRTLAEGASMIADVYAALGP